MPDASPVPAQTAAPPESDVGLLRRTMSRHVGVVRDRAGLVEALSVIGGLERQCRSTRFLNMLVAAKMITAAALARTESRGGHYRSDFPDSDPAWQHRTFLTLAEADRIAEENALAETAQAVS